MGGEEPKGPRGRRNADTHLSYSNDSPGGGDPLSLEGAETNRGGGKIDEELSFLIRYCGMDPHHQKHAREKALQMVIDANRGCQKDAEEVDGPKKPANTMFAPKVS